MLKAVRQAFVVGRVGRQAEAEVAQRARYGVENHVHAVDLVLVHAEAVPKGINGGCLLANEMLHRSVATEEACCGGRQGQSHTTRGRASGHGWG